eukprot:TRINITY_DN40079_c0_g1_i1.p1 TRINITY_DN40079_c0_g1~~TRINITY_DN40079_c0_g1_i1.p1  ORF type:complete len:283 (+),score=35.99 TRINITY_DN40079_c0_g1_i1:57-851(+)
MARKTTLAFDLFGTVFNLDSMGSTSRFAEAVGPGKWRAFNALWQAKTLECMLQRNTMKAYEPFSCCLKEAFDCCCKMCDFSMTEEDKEALLNAYKNLDVFWESKEALNTLKQRGYSLCAFSDCTKADVEDLLMNSNMQSYFDQLVVVDEMPRPTFKPDPKVYAYFCLCTASMPANTWLISSNPANIMAGAAFDWKTAWIKRPGKQALDSWPAVCKPSAVLDSLVELPDLLERTGEASKLAMDLRASTPAVWPQIAVAAARASRA